MIKLGFEVTEFELHSLRAGGATAAAINAGALIDCLSVMADDDQKMQRMGI